MRSSMGLRRNRILKAVKSGSVREERNRILFFSVQDDGPGVDVEQMQKETQQDIRTAQHGYGVRNINFRLKLCFGEKVWCYVSGK